MDNRSSATTGLLRIFHVFRVLDLFSIHLPIIRLKQTETCLLLSQTWKSHQCFLAFLFHPSDDVSGVWSQEKWNGGQRNGAVITPTPSSCCMTDLWKCEDCLMMSGRKLQAQVRLCRMHQNVFAEVRKATRDTHMHEIESDKNKKLARRCLVFLLLYSQGPHFGLCAGFIYWNTK